MASKEEPLPSRRVAVIGAGVAGLCCAERLCRSGLQVKVFEQAAKVGGRVATDEVDGFLLDRGFQILIDSYPEVQGTLDVSALGLKAFWPGALIFKGGVWHTIGDPLRTPKLLLRVLTAPIGTIVDRLRLLRLKIRQLLENPITPLSRPETNTDYHVRKTLGFSDSFVDGFLRPFFEAVFVSPLSEQSSHMFEYVLRMLADGSATLPSEGIQAVPAQLAALLPHGTTQLNSEIAEVSSKGVRFRDKNQEWQAFDAVVLATDWKSAARLSGSEVGGPSSTASCTWYFSKAGPPPMSEPLIALPACGPEVALKRRRRQMEENLRRQALGMAVVPGSSDESDDTTPVGAILNVAFPSLVQPSYAPAGQTLVAVTTLGSDIFGDEGRVREQLAEMFGFEEIQKWQLLRRYNIECHQPRQLPLNTGWAKPCRLSSGMYCCGDHRASPTLNAAMCSGKKCAVAVCEDLGLKAAPATLRAGADQQKRSKLLVAVTILGIATLTLVPWRRRPLGL